METVDHLLSGTEFKKSDWNTHLQQTYGINKRHANAVISSAKGRVDGAKEHRILHLRMYGLASDEAAALVIARRAMKLSEKTPRSLTASSKVNSEKHVWSEWNQLNKKNQTFRYDIMPL